MPPSSIRASCIFRQNFRAKKKRRGGKGQQQKTGGTGESEIVSAGKPPPMSISGSGVGGAVRHELHTTTKRKQERNKYQLLYSVL